MSAGDNFRQCVRNELESLHLAGVTHVSLEARGANEEKPGVTSSIASGMTKDHETTVDPPKKSSRTATGPKQAFGPDDESQGRVASDSTRNIKMEISWKTRLAGPFNAPYMTALSSFLRTEKAEGKRIYPPGSQIFRAFELTPFEAVKVVILGQDPYHGAGQAHGLSFSVAAGVQTPPSLRNIYRELEDDLGISHPGHGNLEHWARQGVLLLNACLTVEEGRAGSHQGKGWEPFTDEVISCLNRERENLVFILWGRKAQDKGTQIDRDRHHVICSVHPSPLSASNGFFGSKPFSRANNFLKDTGQVPIDWNPNRP